MTEENANTGAEAPKEGEALQDNTAQNEGVGIAGQDQSVGTQPVPEGEGGVSNDAGNAQEGENSGSDEQDSSETQTGQEGEDSTSQEDADKDGEDEETPEPAEPPVNGIDGE